MSQPAQLAAAAWLIAAVAWTVAGWRLQRAAARRRARIARMRQRPPEPSRPPVRRRLRLPALSPASARWGLPAVLGALGLFLWHSPAIAVAGVLLGVGLWQAGSRWRHHRRRQRLVAAIPELLRGIAGGLRAGSSLRNVLQFLSAQTREPLGSLVAEALSRERLGYALDQIFIDLGKQQQVPALSWLGTALAIQRQTGGSLAQMIDALTEALSNQERLRREVTALTAQGRTSAVVLAGLVPVLLLLVDISDPRYLAPIFSTALGHLLMAYAVCSIAFGLWLITRMVKRV